MSMRITFCNESFVRVIGAPAAIAERTPLLEVVRDAGLRDMFHQVLASGKPLKQRLELPAADGRSFEVQAAPLSVSPSALSRWGAIAVLHDITDLERLERIRKDFVANVFTRAAHAAAIRGYAETLLEGALEDPANNRKFVEIIKAQAARLNNIASDLLVLSELESGEARHYRTRAAPGSECLGKRAAHGRIGGARGWHSAQLRQRGRRLRGGIQDPAGAGASQPVGQRDQV